MRTKQRLNALSVLGAFLALTLGAAAPVLAQTGTVQGQVVDANSQRPLSGAQVSIVGTGIGQLANASGRFLLLNVPAGEHTVRVEYIGYGATEQQVTVSAGQAAIVDFTMSPTAISLDELVVTGVGAQTTRRALGTTVDVLSEETIALAPVQSVDQLLQGRVAGATVNAVSAQPGTGSLINFRGVSSVFGAQTPVIYIDGVRVDNDQATADGTGGEQSSALADLLTSDIERIEVTKGGAASTLYGSDAATGVIQIFTKKGTPGAPRVTARMEQGIATPELKYMFDTGVIWPDRVDEADANGVVGSKFLQDNYFKSGHTQNYYVGVNGGTADVTYAVSGRLEDSEGTQPKNDATNYNLRGGIQASVSENFTLDFSGSYTRNNYGRLYNGTAIADPLTTFEVGDALFFSGASTLQEALDIFLMPNIDEQVSRFIFSSGARWAIRDDLSARLTVGVDNRNSQQRQYQPIGFTPGEPTGSLNRFDRSFTSVSLDAGATYSWENEGGSVTSATTVGAQGFREDESQVEANGTTFALPGTFDFDEAALITAQEGNTQVFNGGFYLDQQVGLQNKFYVGAGFRIDAGSSFGDDIDTELYPKATGSYILSEDLQLGFVDELKLRAAYGETGKFPGAFLKDRTFQAESFRAESAPRFDNPGNADLRPEKTSTVEAGLDIALLSNRVGLNFTWYNAVTSDALFQVPEQPVTGLDVQQRNVGEITNTGVEVAANVQLVNTPSLAWSVGGTFQYNDNEVTDMGGVSDFFAEGDKRVSQGHPVGAWRVTTPVDTNGDGLNDASEERFSGGAPVPNKSGSFNTALTLGQNLTISALADWAGGHEVFDWGSVWATFNGIFRRELIQCGENPASDCEFRFPVQYNLDGTERGRYSTFAAESAYLYDGDWFKLRELTVRYGLPESVASGLNVSRATIYATGRNLWIWSRNELVDPELSGVAGANALELGSESSITLSPNRTFRLGVEVVF